MVELAITDGSKYGSPLLIQLNSVTVQRVYSRIIRHIQGFLHYLMILYFAYLYSIIYVLSRAVLLKESAKKIQGKKLVWGIRGHLKVLNDTKSISND